MSQTMPDGGQTRVPRGPNFWGWGSKSSTLRAKLFTAGAKLGKMGAEGVLVLVGTMVRRATCDMWCGIMMASEDAQSRFVRVRDLYSYLEFVFVVLEAISEVRDMINIHILHKALVIPHGRPYQLLHHDPANFMSALSYGSQSYIE